MPPENIMIYSCTCSTVVKDEQPFVCSSSLLQNNVFSSGKPQLFLILQYKAISRQRDPNINGMYTSFPMMLIGLLFL